MKKLYLFSLLYISFFSTSLLTAQTDLELVKPIIHIIDSLNGGYYGGLSRYHVLNYSGSDSTTQIYIGAIVKNNGQDTVTNYFLRINAFVDYSIAGNGSPVNITRYSDTLPYLAPGATDTIRLPVLSLSSYVDGWNSWNNTSLSYQLFHDSVDVIPANDSISLPVILYRDYAYRLGEINDTINLINHPKYPSGSFIGISSPVWLARYTTNMLLGVANTTTLQNINIEIRIYVDTSLVATFYPNLTPYLNVYTTSPWPTPLDSIYYIWSDINTLYTIATTWNDTSTFTIGVYYEYDTTATNIPPFEILADTGNYHSFDIETRALVNGTWQSMDFVPLIFQFLEWESIEEFQNSAEVYWFPNPASAKTSLRIRQPNLKNYPATVTVLDITGKQVLSAKVTNNQSIDVSALSPGVYTVLTHINGQRFASKLLKQ